MHAKTLGDRLRQARDNRALTQDQLAQRIGVSRSLISQWENGIVQEIGASHLWQAARTLKVSLDWLLEGDDEPACAEPPPIDYSIIPAALVTAWAGLTQAQRAELLAEAERRAAHNRALLAELAGLPR
jgi:transcriptional regulator with XRE-family HTH domain